MGQGSLLDYGMFMQNIMIAARARGLDTCPQAAPNQFHKIIARQLDLPASQKIICGMALGYADPSKIENTLETVREPLANFTFSRIILIFKSVGLRIAHYRLFKSAGCATKLDRKMKSALAIMSGGNVLTLL